MKTKEITSICLLPGYLIFPMAVRFLRSILEHQRHCLGLLSRFRIYRSWCCPREITWMSAAKARNIMPRSTHSMYWHPARSGNTSYRLATFQNMVGVWKPGGIIVMACATVDRPEHGTTRARQIIHLSRWVSDEINTLQKSDNESEKNINLSKFILYLSFWNRLWFIWFIIFSVWRMHFLMRFFQRVHLNQPHQ